MAAGRRAPAGPRTRTSAGRHRHRWPYRQVPESGSGPRTVRARPRRWTASRRPGRPAGWSASGLADRPGGRRASSQAALPPRRRPAHALAPGPPSQCCAGTVTTGRFGMRRGYRAEYTMVGHVRLTQLQRPRAAGAARNWGGRLRRRKYLRHNDVVKYMGPPDAPSRAPGTGDARSAAPAQITQAQPGSERGTRARIARLILENGPVTAAGLSVRLGLTPAAVRRHLDNLAAEGMIEIRMARSCANRGRGRPARMFAITDAGRSAFEHTYDDLATSALRFLEERAGPQAVTARARRSRGARPAPQAVTEYARRQVADLERRYRPVVESAPLADRVRVLAMALSVDGYAASAT